MPWAWHLATSQTQAQLLTDILIQPSPEDGCCPLSLNYLLFVYRWVCQGLLHQFEARPLLRLFSSLRRPSSVLPGPLDQELARYGLRAKCGHT